MAARQPGKRVERLCPQSLAAPEGNRPTHALREVQLIVPGFSVQRRTFLIFLH